ncbi:MAG: Mce-associated rane protein [Mycobacterium sp.]|nr:Mce-associated rane protein [Mycobacterium sp.]
MPSGKKARIPKVEPEPSSAEPQAEPTPAVEEPTPAVEEPTPPVEVTAPPVEEPPVKQGRQRNLFRRKKSDAAPAEVEPAEVEPAEPPADQVIAEESDGDTIESGDEAAESAEAEAEAVDEPVLVPHRPAGKRLKLAAAAAAALFVAGGAFLGATAQPVIANRALVETKLNVARTAANAITTLWSYSPENMDSLGDRSAKYLTGDFAFQYRKFIDSIVATNKQAQVTNTTSVLGSAVESVSPTEASAVVYTNSVATSPVSKNIPSLRYLSYRLEMKRDRTDWRITRMTTITTLDLTPQV